MGTAIGAAMLQHAALGLRAPKKSRGSPRGSVQHCDQAAFFSAFLSKNCSSSVEPFSAAVDASFSMVDASFSVVSTTTSSGLVSAFLVAGTSGLSRFFPPCARSPGLVTLFDAP